MTGFVALLLRDFFDRAISQNPTGFDDRCRVTNLAQLGEDVRANQDRLLEIPSQQMNQFAKLDSSQAGLVVGSRYVPGGEIPNWSWHRKALSKWGNRYAGFVLGLPVRDATSGFRVYRSDVFDRLGLDTVHADGYGFQIEMAYKVRGLGELVVEHPISFRDRERGTSKMSGSIVVEALWMVTWWALRDRVLRRRPRVQTAR